MSPDGLLEDIPPIDFAPGARFGNYEIVRKLGEGGMGAVYEARRQGLNKRVALKVLTVGGSAAATARFVQEARISASLEHPHVVDCIDVGEAEGMPFLALEFLDGETLGARMDRGPMTVAEIVDIALPVCSALLVAHERGVVHRDLKPENIFLARQAGALVPKVLDFGIAKARTGPDGQGLTMTAAIMGTPGYMSPEQARDTKNVGPATDQFALGVILWESLTSRPLFEGEAAYEVLSRVVSQPAPPLRTLRPDVDEGFEALVARMLEKEAPMRFPSLREVGACLLPYGSPEVRARWAHEFDGLDAQALLRASMPGTSTGVATLPNAAGAAAPVTAAPTLQRAAPVVVATPVAAPAVAPSSRAGVIVLAAFAVFFALGAVGWMLLHRETVSTAPAAVTAPAAMAGATDVPAQPPVTAIAAPTTEPTPPAVAPVPRPVAQPLARPALRPERPRRGHGRRHRAID